MSPDLGTSKEVEKLDVYRGVEHIGALERSGSGASFAYNADYAKAHAGSSAKAVAFSMPVREQPHAIAGTNLHPFFAGLLPEGLRLHALVRGLKTSEDDLFSMLVAAGGNTVGDIWVRPSGLNATEEAPLLDTRKLDQSSFSELLAESLNWQKRGDSITVAGIQPKLSAAMISFPLRGKTPHREFILKLMPAEYPRLVENEFFFMSMLRAMKLSSAKVELVRDRDGETGLLVERFDRVQDPANRTGPSLRLHQEDACQLLSRYPSDKYRISLREIAEALEVCSAPMVERLRLLQLQALSYLIGNGDLHGKNISVQVVDRQVRLTPIYDVLSTLPYGDDHLALQMDGRDKSLRRKDFVAFGERIGIRQPATERMLDALVEKVAPYAERVGEIGFDARKTRQLKQAIAKHLDQSSG